MRFTRSSLFVLSAAAVVAATLCLLGRASTSRAQSSAPPAASSPGGATDGPSAHALLDVVGHAPSGWAAIPRLIQQYAGKSIQYTDVQQELTFAAAATSGKHALALVCVDSSNAAHTAFADSVLASLPASTDGLDIETNATPQRMSAAVAHWQGLGYATVSQQSTLALPLSGTEHGSFFQWIPDPGEAHCFYVDTSGGATVGWYVALSTSGGVPTAGASKGIKDLLCAVRATLVCAGAAPGVLFATSSQQASCCDRCLTKVWNFNGNNHCHACDGCITPLCNTVWCWVLGVCHGC